MLKTFQFWIARSFVLSFLVLLVFFVALVISFQIAKFAPVLFGSGASIITIMTLMYEIILSFLSLATPLAVLFAALYTMSRLSKESEYIALRSLGASPWQIYVPIFLISSFIGIYLYILNLNIVPFATRNFKMSIVKMQSENLLGSLKSAEFFTDIAGLSFFAQKVENRGKNMEHLFIEYQSEKKEEPFKQIIMAQKGSIGWEKEWLVLHLSQGNIIRFNKKANEFEKIIFEGYQMPLVPNEEIEAAKPRGSSLTQDELRHFMDNPKESIVRWGKEDFIKIILEYHSRINIMFQCILFSLLGFSLGIVNMRGKNSNTFYLILSLCVYFGLYFSFISFGKKEKISMALAIYLPSFLLMLWSGYLFIRSRFID